MGPTKIMIIRHAEKPGTYDENEYKGINAFGEHDKESLITLGWERAGGIANVFDPTTHPKLATPDFIYASNPAIHHDMEPSQRPYQTISALAGKLNVQPNTSFPESHYRHMVTAVLALHVAQNTCTVLIAWQHEDILPKESSSDSIVSELLKQTKTGNLPGVPTGPWPEDRYDMVFVFDRPNGNGPLTGFTQVPQLLLAGDSMVPIP